MADYTAARRDSRAESVNSTLLTINATKTVMTVFILLIFVGFPGKLSKIIGGGASTMLDYAAFGMQMLLVLLASGDDVMNIKLLNLQPAYRIIYVYMVFVCAESYLVTIDRKAIFITLLHLIVTILFSLWMVEQFSPRELLEVIYYAQFLFVIFNVITIIVFPNLAFYKLEGVRTLGGLFKTKNELGTELSFGLLVQCILLRMRREKNEASSLIFYGVMIVQFGLIVISRNMGALLITITYIGYILYYGMHPKMKRLRLGLLFVGGAIGFLVFALTVLQAMEPLLAAVGKSASLTGRVPLWQQTITVMTESHTLTGYGYEMFWRTPSAVTAFHSGFPENSWAATTSSSLHNSVMELWANTGLLGVALFMVMFLVAERGIPYLDENQYLYCSGYIIMYLVRSLTERQNDPGTIYVLMLYVVLALMLHANMEHKIAQQRKARVYVAPEEESVKTNWHGERLDDQSDLSAFQQRFSNLAGNDKNKPHAQTSDFFANLPDDEEEEPTNRLQSLLEEFDGDID